MFVKKPTGSRKNVLVRFAAADFALAVALSSMHSWWRFLPTVFEPPYTNAEIRKRNVSLMITMALNFMLIRFKVDHRSFKFVGAN